jgi:F-type H+-transporting ATPase subunit b
VGSGKKPRRPAGYLEGNVEGLGISIPTLITQVVTFIILLVVLRFVAYKPIMRMLDERSRKIKESMEQAEALKEQSAKGEEELKVRLEAASREGQERIARAMKAGEDVKQKAQEDARKEAEDLIARARAEIQQERDDAISEVRREFADLTVLAAEKVIEKSLDKEEHRELIDKVLEESTTRNKE